MELLQNKRILVTGGAGFIGSNIVQYLLMNNVRMVRVLDNLSTGSFTNLTDLMNCYPQLEFMQGDIRDYSTCVIATQSIDVICHQAALGSVPRSFEDPIKSHENNVTGFLNILHAARTNGIKRIVYASSSSVYGSNSDINKTENNIGLPLSPYAMTKYMDELYADLYTRLFQLECIGLRYFNVFGPKQNPSGAYAAVIPKFIGLIATNQPVTIHGDGMISRDFTYVSNIVQANVLALSTCQPEAFGTVFNIGAQNTTTINELYKRISTIMQSESEPIHGPSRPGDIQHSLSDSTKATTILSYHPTVQLNEGLIKTIEWFRNSSV